MNGVPESDYKSDKVSSKKKKLEEDIEVGSNKFHNNNPIMIIV